MCAGNFNHPDEMLARPAFASQKFENVDSLAYLACAGNPRRNSEKVSQTDEFGSLGSGGQRGWPTEQEGNVAGRLKEVLFLPAVVVAEQIAMVGKKADENVRRVWPRFDCIEYSPEAIVQISDFAVVTCLYDLC